MRNWASYVKIARENAGMTRPVFARAVEVGRTTVWRWETGEQTPENAQVVVRVAEATGVDVDEALAAAGLRPGVDAPSEPANQATPLDPEVAELNRKLADPDISPEEKIAIRTMIRYINARRDWPEPDEPERRRAVS